MSQMMTNNSLVKIQEHPPYSAEMEGPVLLNPLARIEADGKGGYHYSTKQPLERVFDSRNSQVFKTALSAGSSSAGVGVDQGERSNFVLYVVAELFS